MKKSKQEIITFKTDAKFAEALEGIPNRSAFIRTAVLAALKGLCPLCKGTGILTPEQREHWDNFARNHSVEQCNSCSAFHLVCDAEQSSYEHEL